MNERGQIIRCPSDGDERAHLNGGLAGPDRNMSYSFNALTLAPDDPAATMIQYPGGGPRRLGIPITQVKKPAERIYIYEEIGPNDAFCLDPMNNMDDLPTGRHTTRGTLFATRTQSMGSNETAWLNMGRGNHCFFDGHVESLPPSVIRLSNRTYGGGNPLRLTEN